MKRFITLLPALLLVLSLAACGGTNVDTGADSSASSTSSIDSSVSTSSVNGQTSGDETGPDDEAPEAVPREFLKGAAIEETVLVDENDVRITARELTYGSYAAELTLGIENNSDRNLSIIANSVGYSCNSVNGYMIPEGYLNCDVAAGKKANASISISYDTLMLYGIFEIADMEVGFDIVDDDYNHIYTGPRSITTSAAESHDYETPCYRESIASKASQAEYGYSVPYFSADTVYEKNGIVIASQTVMEKKDGESILLLEVVNTTDGMIGVSTTNIDINDLRVCDSTWSYDSINPGKTAIVDVALCSVLEREYWEVYGISGADHIALRAVFKDSDGNEAADYADLSIDISGTDASFSREGTEIYNGNGIRIVSKGVYADPSEYSDDLHILLFAENTSGQTLSLQDVYGSLSINDYMAAYSFCTTTMEDGSCAMIDITLWGYGLEDINISEPSEVQNVGFSLSVRDQNYKELDQVSIGFAVE